jgi:hypothetical protein
MFALFWFCMLSRKCYITQNVKEIVNYKTIKSDEEKNLAQPFFILI